MDVTLICTMLLPMNPARWDKYHRWTPENIYETTSLPGPRRWIRTIVLAYDLMDQKTPHLREKQYNNKRKADDSSRNIHGPNSNPSRDRISPKSTTWRKAKGSLMGDLCPSANKCHLTPQWTVAPRGAQVQQDRALGFAIAGNTRHFKRDCPKLKNKVGEWNAQRMGLCSWNAEKWGKQPGNPVTHVVTVL
ncbi:hypothetical protein Tco_1408995 [Tanacetum coccineum]